MHYNCMEKDGLEKLVQLEACGFLICLVRLLYWKLIKEVYML